ncbi:MAG: hypothetical protein ACRC14_18915 [Paracoccaceae bacterium]
MEVVIIERGAYGNRNCDRFNVVRGGVVVAFGLHHKAPFRSEWVNTKTGERFGSKAALMESISA